MEHEPKAIDVETAEDFPTDEELMERGMAIVRSIMRKHFPDWDPVN